MPELLIGLVVIWENKIYFPNQFSVDQTYRTLKIDVKNSIVYIIGHESKLFVGLLINF